MLPGFITSELMNDCLYEKATACAAALFSTLCKCTANAGWFQTYG
jgi:hypothetical protein